MSSTGSPMLTPLEAFAQAFTSLGILASVVNTSGGIYCVEARMRDGDALIVGTTKNVWCADVVDRTRKRVDSINSNIRWQGILAERKYAGIARHFVVVYHRKNFLQYLHGFADAAPSAAAALGAVASPGSRWHRGLPLQRVLRRTGSEHRALVRGDPGSPQQERH